MPHIDDPGPHTFPARQRQAYIKAKARLMDTAWHAAQALEAIGAFDGDDWWNAFAKAVSDGRKKIRESR